jgi:DNA-binding NarL/FixJ family response regulator
MTVTVVIADDQHLVRAGLRLILDSQSDIEVVGEADTGNKAIALVESLHPDVVLMDIRMPGIDGIEATRRIVCGSRAAGTRIIILTTFDLDEYVYDALNAGASGFLLKDAPPEQLVASIRMIERGDALLAPSITRRLVEEFTRPRPQPTIPPGLDQLSPREAEVLRLIARGLSNQEIAAELYVGENTVKTHVTRVLAKLGLRDRIQVVVLAYETGLITPGTGS